jgi:transcriptional regulator NrdR family protein
LTERLHRMGYGDVAQERLLSEMQAIRRRRDCPNSTVAAMRRSSAMTSMEFRTDGDRHFRHHRDPAQRT